MRGVIRKAISLVFQLMSIADRPADEDPSGFPDGLLREKADAPLKGVWFSHRDARVDAPIVVYVYGSAFLVNHGPMHERIAAHLAGRLQGHVLLLNYRLAPEEPFPLGIEDVAVACRTIFGRDSRAPSRTVIFADGAGAALALAALQLLRASGDSMPAGLALLCPWADLTFSGGAYLREMRPGEFVSNLELLVELSLDYLQGADPHHPLASPALADLAGLPEMLIHVARTDPCADDGAAIARRARTGGARVHLHEWPDLPYAWHVLRPLEASVAAVLASIAQFIERRTTPAARNAVDLEKAYREGIVDYVEPHMADRIDEIFEWAHAQGPGWIWPMIDRRVERGALICQEEVEREWLSTLFDDASKPLALLTASRQIAFANREAQALLADALTIDVSDGRLRFLDRRAEAALERAFELLFAPVSAVPQVPRRRAALSVDERGERLYLDLRRLAPSREDVAAPPAVLVRFLGQGRPRLETSLLQSLFDLSAREAHLAVKFALGTTLAAYAESEAIGMPTVRTHFANVKRKIGARDQADAVRILLSLAE